MDIKNLLTQNVDTVIGVDTDRELIHIYSKKTGKKNSISHTMYNYKAKPFTSEFYDKLGVILGQFRQDNPEQKLQRASVVLSDSAVLTDTISIPVINKKAMDNSLTASINNLYGNSSDLKFNRVYITQVKQLATYAISAMRKQILVNIQKACGDQQISVANITFASSAATNAAMTLNPKLKNTSYIILDIKEEFSKVIFAVKGKTLGFYHLPFGYKILYKTRISPEDLLFDHGTAELVVLNAKEKAKAKALTMADDEEVAAQAPTAEENSSVVVEEDDDWLEILPPRPKLEEEEDEELEAELMAEEESESEFISRGRKKAPRKLPKFMLRPTPTNRADFMYENFRIFMKWTLELIASNPAIVNLGTPEAVYVNMPDEYFFLYEKANIEVEDNGVRFMPLLAGEKKDIVKKNLELYGGFYTKQYNKFNNFHASQLDNIKSRANEKSANKENGDSIVDKLKETLKKVVEAIKKIATYDLGGGGN